MIADVILNFCGALGVALAMAQARRRDPFNPASRALQALFAALALLLAARGAAWATDWRPLDDVAVLAAIFAPVTLLLASEHLLRRHAPRALKIFVIGAACALFVLWLAGVERAAEKIYYLALAIFQFSTVLFCAALLVLRNRALLSGAENRLIDRLGYAFLIAAPFLLTDFRAVWAHPPARLGALGLLIALAALQASDGGARRAYFGLLALRLVAGALFGLAIAVMAGQTDAVALVRFAAVACAFALTLAMAGEALQQAFATRAPGVFSALAAADVTTREAFVAALEAHPAFSGLAALGPSELVDYDPQMLAGALEEGEVIGARALRGLAAPIRERLEALLAARQATHALVLSKAPLRLMTLAAPGVAVDPALDEALPVLGRLAARLPEKGASGDI